MKGSSASIGLGSLSLRSSQSLASIEANEVQLLQADLLRPEARAFLKSNKSLDKIVKSYVRKPMHLKATQVRSQPNLHMADRLMSPGGSRELDGSLLDYRMADPDPDHGSSMSMTLASEVNMVINSRPNSPAHRPNSGLPYVAKRNMKLNGTPRQPTSRRSPTRPLSPPVLSRTSSRSGSRSPARPSSPAKEQLRENLLPIWNEVTSHTNFPPSPTQTNIKGSLVPAHYVKESMIELVRKHDTQRRLRLKELLGGNKKKTLGDGEVVKGELAFEDSTTASTTPRKLASLAPSNFNGSFNGSFNDSFLFPEGSQDGTYVDGLNGVDLGGSRALASTSNMPSKKDLAMESLLSSTQRSKISSMIRIEDDYSAKWLRMKEKRDQRYEREIRRQARTEIMHTFKRVVLNTERNEFERTMMTIKDEQLHGSIESRDEIQQRRFKQKASLQNRLAGERAKKHKEANKIKTAMNITLQMAQAVKDHELSLKRAQHDEMLFQMDDSTSSIVEVPNELHQRVQSATRLVPLCFVYQSLMSHLILVHNHSLKAYEAAKKEVREYQESTMSSRIAKIAKSRGDALDRVNSFGKYPLLVMKRHQCLCLNYLWYV